MAFEDIYSKRGKPHLEYAAKQCQKCGDCFTVDDRYPFKKPGKDKWARTQRCAFCANKAREGSEYRTVNLTEVLDAYTEHLYNDHGN